MKARLVIISAIIFIIGLIIGSYLSRNTQPRSFLSIENCQGTCLKSKDLAGLVASIGINNAPNLMPNVVLETDKTIVIKHPFPEYPIHYVAIPKKDIKNAADITVEDQAFLQDAYNSMANMIREKNISKYKIITNGPGYQEVTYLHFHLVGKNDN